MCIRDRPESYKDAEIKLQEVEKNNGLKLTGITIPNGDQRIVPTVYLDSVSYTHLDVYNRQMVY